jgi:hypothetical protein
MKGKATIKARAQMHGSAPFVRETAGWLQSSLGELRMEFGTATNGGGHVVMMTEAHSPA